MKSKTKIISVLAIALVSSLILLSPAIAACNLPPTPVTMTVGTGEAGPIEITISGIVGTYDVANGPYTGYCAELGVEIVSPTSVMLVCTDAMSPTYNEINWLLNNYPDSLDLQLAIWRLLGYTETEITNMGWTYTAAADAMYTAALTHGSFVPTAGEWKAVLCEAEEGQDFLIKIQIPNESPGLTPGFWKNNLAVYLGYANGNRGYSDPEGSPTVTKATMADFFDSLAGTYDLNQLYSDLCPQLTGTTAEIRNAAANIFNVEAGLAPGPPWN